MDTARQPSAAEAMEKYCSDSTARRILIVEEEPALRRLIAQRVHSLGYAADAAEGLTHARALSSAHSYQVVLTDLLLPAGRGVQFIAELSARNPLTMFIIMTGVADLTATRPTVRTSVSSEF